MEMFQMLVICVVLVASVHAGQMKSAFVKNNDTCDKYTSTSEYERCGEVDKNGKELCYLSKMNHVKCDSVKDCPNFADEKGCKQQHEEYCQTGFDEKKNLTAFFCAPFSTEEGFPANDRMCIATIQLCDNVTDCPQGDDEDPANCPE